MAVTTPTPTTTHADAERVVEELFFTDEGRRDPHPRYHRLRTLAPVHRSDVLGGTWLLTRYDDCRAVLRDPRFEKRFAQTMDRGSGSWRTRPSTSSISRTMLMADPPGHSRLRRRVARSFTPRRVRDLRPTIEATVGRLLDDFDATGGGDLMDQIAFRLPVVVIGDLLGIPRRDLDQFRDPILALTQCLEVPVAREQLDEADQSYALVAAYFRDLIERRRAEPGDDLLSALVVDDAEDALDDQELVDMALLLFIAGFETTTNLIGNAVVTFDEQPEEYALLRSEPELAANLALELLRHDTSVQLINRVATEDVEVGGTTIPTGSRVFVMLGAANRDPSVFEDPDRLDLRRADIGPLAFGGGIHHCLGAALAATEIEVLFTEMARRYPRLDIFGERPAHRPRLALRGTTSIELRVDTPAGTTPATPVRPSGADLAWRADHRVRLETATTPVDPEELHARTQLLRTNQFFTHCTDHELNELASTAYPLSFDPGETLLAQGAPSPDVFLLTEGDIAVTVDGTPVANIGPDGLVGERGVITGSPRAATVRALTHVQAIVLSAHRLAAILESNPAAAAHMRAGLRRYGRRAGRTI